MSVDELMKAMAQESARAASVFPPVFDAMKALLTCGVIHSDEYVTDWKPSDAERAVLEAFGIDIGYGNGNGVL